MKRLVLFAVFACCVSTSFGALASEIEAELVNKAQLGSTEAQVELANKYLKDEIDGTDVNKLKTLRWIKSLAEEGDTSLQLLLAQMYYVGIGTAPNESEGVAWTRKAAELGDPDAQGNMSHLYHWGYAGLDSSHDLAIEWALKAANQGDAWAQRELGDLYDLPGTRDEEKSLKWNTVGYESYKVLAESGDVDAQWALADMYFYGIDAFMVNFDRKEAFKWYVKAADQGHVAAQIAVGQAYNKGGLSNDRGYGVEKDDEKSIVWYTKAAEQGAEEAVNALKTSYDIDFQK